MPQFQVLPKVPGFGEQLGAQLGSGLQQGITQQLNQMLQEKEIAKREREFTERGLPPPLARLAAIAPVGGQTEIFKSALEEFRRGQKPSLKVSEDEGISPEEKEEEVDVGLTPAERIKREETRFGKQLERYEGLETKINSLSTENSKIQRLQQLNEGGNLPKGLGRLNVNLKSGELRVPFLAGADTQEFVKIVNDFLSGAKDTFGARVTNFELDRFMKRLPTLLNTEEGRRAILRQMEIINEINTLHDQGVLDEFDKRGGIRKIDYDQAVRNSKRKIKPEIEDLRKEYISHGKPLLSTEKKSSEIEAINPQTGQRLILKDGKWQVKK